MPSQRVKNKFWQLLENARYLTEFEGLTGTLNSDGSVNPNPTYGLISGYIWVRASAGGVPRVVRNVNVRTDIANVPVICERLAGGEYQVKQVEPVKGQIALGSAISSVNTPDIQGQLLRFTLRTRNLAGGRLSLASEGALIFKTDEFPYIDSAGDDKYVTEGAYTINLLSNVPAASGGVNQTRWVRVALNPDASSPALVAFNGTAQAVTAPPLDTSSIKDVSITPGYYSLGAVKLTTGDTTITDSAAIVDYRHFINNPRFIQYSTANVSNPPTDAELDSVFGSPAAVGTNFAALLNDAGGATNEYLVLSDGANWLYAALTKAV